jgi:hypothetical protein
MRAGAHRESRKLRNESGVGRSRGLGDSRGYPGSGSISGERRAMPSPRRETRPVSG